VLGVARQPALHDVQAVGPFDAPPDGLGDESAAGRVARHDLHADAQHRAVLDHGVLGRRLVFRTVKTEIVHCLKT